MVIHLVKVILRYITADAVNGYRGGICNPFKAEEIPLIEVTPEEAVKDKSRLDN
jgi:hypothetical protein